MYDRWYFYMSPLGRFCPFKTLSSHPMVEKLKVDSFFKIDFNCLAGNKCGELVTETSWVHDEP